MSCFMQLLLSPFNCAIHLVDRVFPNPHRPGEQEEAVAPVAQT
jgi:hypothetical protein